MASVVIPASPSVPWAKSEFLDSQQLGRLGNQISSNERLSLRKTKMNRSAVRADSAEQEQVATAEPKRRDKGWFYNNFVADQTMEARLKKLREDSKATKGQVKTMFDDSFQYTSWIEVHRALTERQLPSVVPAEALRMATSFLNRAVLLDVREAGDYANLHAEGAFNAPLFRLIQGNDVKANLRRLGYALITDFAGTERNPEFVAQAEAAVQGKKSRPVIVMCGRGGTLDTFVERKGPKAKKYEDPWRTFGIASRSLKACYELQEAGFSKVYHLKGGFNLWKYEDLPLADDP